MSEPLGMWVRIRDGWQNEGKIGVCLGPAMLIIPYKGSSGQFWTPVLWDGEEDPDWFKSSGLTNASPTAPKAKRLLMRIQQP
jgi:hypothetical protein